MAENIQISKLTELREQRIFFALGWTAYFSTYIGRLNFTASLAQIASSAGFSRDELGLVSSGFFIGYGAFQLVWSFAGDTFDPVRMVFAGVLASGLFNCVMAFAQTPGFMAVAWTLNGIAQSAVWSPLLRLTVERLPGVLAMRCSIRYSLTVPAGTFAAYALSALCAGIGSWRAVFVTAGILLILASLCWLRGMRPLAPGDALLRIRGKGRSERQEFSLRLVLLLVPICLAAVLNGLVRDGMQTWMPSYLSDSYGLSGVLSIVLTLILPIVNLTGVYLGKLINERFLHNEAAVAAVSFAGATAVLLPAIFCQQLPLWCTLALLGICAAMMLSVNTMLVTLVPVRLQYTGHVSMLSGLLNSATYIGSTISGYGVGAVLEHYSWSAVLMGWCIGAAAASLLCLSAARIWGELRK